MVHGVRSMISSLSQRASPAGENWRQRSLAAKAATKAAQKPPLDVSNTSQFRDLANSSSRIFGWNTKVGPQTQFNQVVISQEQLKQIGMLRDSTSPEEQEELSKKVLAMTPEEWEKFRKKTSEFLARGQSVEPQALPLPTPPGPVTYEVKIKGDGTGVKITGDERPMD
jgi:hypothetical protein